MTDFGEAFRAVTGHKAFGWQQRLYKALLRGGVPSVCAIPTGLGKTSVIPIWLIALATQAEELPRPGVPRRLVYIVNRRTVVDQATTVAEQVRQRVLAGDRADAQRDRVLRQLRQALARLGSGGSADPITISTLRGELADNEEWKADPARPAIIIGTVDMTGSKLLFSGYGDGRYRRAHHAGLIGQDALIVHDEAHLTPAFGDLLGVVAEVQRHAGEPRPVQVMELSATSRGGSGNVLTLQPDEERDEIVRERLYATKRLRIHQDGGKDLPATLARLVLAHEASAAKVLVYVRSPEEVQRVADALRGRLGQDAARGRVALLTGTVRGHERDGLVRSDPVYRALLCHEAKVERTVYLLSTSAGEVGIDLDADHMVCDLTTLDSMIQRLGRVNRRGGPGRCAQVDVVFRKDGDASADKASPFKQAVAATGRILSRWAEASGNGLDVSPRNLQELIGSLDENERTAAFSPKPPVPPLTDILLDAWSLTSVREPMPGRPEVAAYLHGLTMTNAPPETFVAWRKEVMLLRDAHPDREQLSGWFEACPIKARERLRDRTERVYDELKKIAKRRGDERTPVVLLDERGDANLCELAALLSGGVFGLAYRTVVLPTEAGGLNDWGMLDAASTGPAEDVAETAEGEGVEARRERWLCIEDEEGERYERLISGEAAASLPQGLRERQRVVLREPVEGAEEEGGSRCLLLMVQPRQAAQDDPESVRTNQSLDEHTRQVVEYIRRMARSLGLPSSLEDALRLAAEWHDRGKSRPIWQHYACNPDLANPLAKSTEYLPGRILGGYRHEFGSLLDADTEAEVRNHLERDLILHLIAAHHGWGRPHFEPRAADTDAFSSDASQRAAAEVMRGFGRLQQRFGRWGLAWLESLLRCADIAASKQAAQGQTESPVKEVSA